MFNFGFKLRYAARSPDWSKVRNEYLKNNKRCAACGTNTGLEVHHIKPVHLFPEKELDIDNLVTLCSKKCHLLFGHLMNFKSWNPEVIEDCKKMYKKIENRK